MELGNIYSPYTPYTPHFLMADLGRAVITPTSKSIPCLPAGSCSTKEWGRWKAWSSTQLLPSTFLYSSCQSGQILCVLQERNRG